MNKALYTNANYPTNPSPDREHFVTEHPSNRCAFLLADALSAFYGHDIAPLLEQLAPCATVISPAGDVAQGEESVHRLLERLISQPFMRMDNQTFTTRKDAACQRDGLAIVVGSYRLTTIANEQVLFAAPRHVTACFQRDHSQTWRLFHLHISQQEDPQIDESLFPFAVNRETYNYVRRILYRGRRSGILPSRIAIDDGKLHYFNPDDILYIQAQGKFCEVHTSQKILNLNRLLGDVENLMGGTFVRTHRSYIVNASHVTSIERYQLTLNDGTQLPIPKQRFTQIRREIFLRIAG